MGASPGEALHVASLCDDGEAVAFFDACPTSFAQQTLAWRDVITRIDRDEPMFLGCWQASKLVGVLPAYRFEGPLGAIMSSVPQAGPLGGVACLPGVNPAPVYRSLLDAHARQAADTGCSFASVITNPFWPDLELYGAFAAEYTLENSCLALDLQRDVTADGRFLRPARQLARQLRRALSGRLRIDEQQSAENVAAWYAIHEARHGEIGATPLPRAMFDAALLHAVPRGKARFFFVRDTESGEMVAGGFYLLHGQVIDALMPAVRSEHAKLGANYLLACHSIRWAREQGLRYYNWQASPPGGGVARFKQQWGSREFGYAYLTRVTGDPAPFLNSTPAALRGGYPWHYVLPFDRLGVGAGRAGVSTRAEAWARLEADGEGGGGGPGW